MHLGTSEFQHCPAAGCRHSIADVSADGSHAFLSTLGYSSTLHSDLSIKLLGGKIMWGEGKALVIRWQHIQRQRWCLSMLGNDDGLQNLTVSGLLQCCDDLGELVG